MDKSIEIDGRVIHISSKTIEINGSLVITQGDIKIIHHLDKGLERNLDSENNGTYHAHQLNFASL